MAQIGQLLKQLIALNPQSHPIRLAAYNYFSTLYGAVGDLSSETLNQFFADCLTFPHWQQESKELSREMRNLLESIWSPRDDADGFNRFCDSVQWPGETQVITIEHFNDTIDLIERYLSECYPAEEKFRLVPDHGKSINAYVQTKNGQIEVRCFDNRFRVLAAQLVPLREDLILRYDARLELQSAVYHKLEIGPYTTARFQVLGPMPQQEARGNAVRGYLFQKHLGFRGQPLKDQTKLFFAIKRLEQVLVDRRTDSFYQDLMNSLERSSNLLKMNDAKAIEDAPGVLAHAEAALEQVFIGDKLLSLLIRDLKNLWHSKNNPQKFV